MRRMIPSIRSRWVAALQSGDYPQLINDPFLAREVDGVWRWNALGVLCDVTFDIDEDIVTIGPLRLREYDGSVAMLTPRLCSIMGIAPERGVTVAGIYIDKSYCIPAYDIKNLSQLGVPFQDLAEIIKEQV